MNKYSNSIFEPPRTNAFALGLLFCVAFIFHLTLIGNPGFFSHDELQKVDHISQHGFADYVNLYVRFYQSAEFGQPLRPFSFLVQGVTALFMLDYPVAAHVFDILTHWLIACLFFLILDSISKNRPLSWLASLIFLSSPLVTFSVGWSAALMDRFYVLFGLIAFWGGVNYILKRGGAINLLTVLVASSFAILSKETAIILPFMLTIFLVFPVAEKIEKKKVAQVFILWLIPIVLFMLYRFPALIGSFSKSTATPYAASFSNLYEGILIYFIYPFIPTLPEIGIWKTQSIEILYFAAALHLSLIAALWRMFSRKIAIFYVFSYFLFVAPVLLISTRGSHYLYGSGLVLSVGLAALIIKLQAQKHHLLKYCMILLIVLSTTHALINQLFIYRIGSCMNTASISMESSYLSSRKPLTMKIEISADAPGHVLYRLTTGRNQIGPYYPVQFEIVNATTSSEKANYIFNKNCVVYTQ